MAAADAPSVSHASSPRERGVLDTHAHPKNHRRRGAGGQTPPGTTHGQAGNTLGSGRKTDSTKPLSRSRAGGEFPLPVASASAFALLHAKPGPRTELSDLPCLVCSAQSMP